MKPLIEIQNIPISIEYKINRSKLEKADSSATVEFSRRKNSVRMKSRPIRVSVDTIESRRATMPRTAAAQPVQPISRQPVADPTVSRLNVASYSATAHFLGNGKMQVDMTLNDEAVAQIADLQRQASANVEYASSYSPEESVVPQNLSVTYEIDKLSFDWSASSRNIEFEFVPASIEFSIAQYPQVVIEYVGGPIYVPPSADPDYVPVNELV